MTPDDLGPYLASTEMIDWQNGEIRQLASKLRLKHATTESTAKDCFEWVRDNIEHSADFDRDVVTCRASDVLKQRTGFCYAKSHLLAALLRANEIPAGFCYQRLSIDGQGPPFCLHGLNAVHLDHIGWYRIDARGNRDDLKADFNPPHECLPFAPTAAGEANVPQVWPEPLPAVVDALQQYESVADLLEHLPDISTRHVVADRRRSSIG